MIFVTGCAGFIGLHTTLRLLAEGHSVVGLDNLNDYYDVGLKEARLAQLTGKPGFTFIRGDLVDAAVVNGIFTTHKPDRVIHLAAQAGVRHSIEAPRAYIDSNITGFLNIIEGCRHFGVKHLVYASSSSVYGLNAAQPFCESDKVDHPVSLYAATKKANELMAHSYSHLFKIPTTGLRFFTAYGPWGRPDMAYFSFTKAIIEGRPIKVFNNGLMKRDFTYIDDIVEGVVRTAFKPAESDPTWDPLKPNPATSSAPYRIYNIGNNTPIALMDFIKTLESAIGKSAILEHHPMQPGDVLSTCAGISELSASIAYKPGTPLAEGLARFVSWYKNQPAKA